MRERNRQNVSNYYFSIFKFLIFFFKFISFILITEHEANLSGGNGRSVFFFFF